MLIIESILAFLEAMWVSLTFIVTIVGILFLWPNIQELPKIYPRLFGWVPRLERGGIALIALVPALLAWILWMDARPYVLDWIQSQYTHPLQIVPFGRDTTKFIIYLPDDDPQKDVTKIIHLIGIRNEDPTNKTIRNVQVQVGFARRPMQLEVEKDGAPTTDIQPGITVYFKFGYTLWRDRVFPPDGFERVTPEKFNRMQLIARDPRLYVEGLREGDIFGLHPADVPWSLNILISADELPLNIAHINVWPDRAEKALEIDESSATGQPSIPLTASSSTE